uniref:Lipocalin n=1 Tax=Rhipicephalus appendiculatus TaxID=34631 RepID=A0A131YG36_RHIAP
MRQYLQCGQHRERSYCLGHQWVNKTLVGTFTNVSVAVNATYDSMIVHPPGIIGKITEELLYADPGFKCGVFKVFVQSNSGSPRKLAIYDLRVRKAYDQPHNAKCLLEFKKHAGKNYVHAFLPFCTSSTIICK